MKTYAVIRVLYGECFAQECIKSILPYVDKVFVCWTDLVWGNVMSCQYKDWNVSFDRKFDCVLDRIAELNNKKIHLIYSHRENNENQFTYLINEKIIPFYGKPDLFLIPEIDHVQRTDQIEGAIKHVVDNNIQNASTMPIELWRNYRYRIPERARMCTMIWNMKDINELPTTGRQANGKNLIHIPFYTWNFGFAVSPHVMYWKHLTSMAFSAKIGDDQPNPDWYEKWLTWKPGVTNLEISQGYEHYIPYACEYNVNELPQIIKEKYGIS